VTSSSSGTDPNFPCPPGDYFFDIVRDGTVQHLTSGCYSEPAPTGVHIAGGGGAAFPLGNFTIQACGMGPLRISLASIFPDVPGSVTNGSTDYADASGTSYQNMQTTHIDLTNVGAVGEPVEGSFDAMVDNPQTMQPPIPISGKFRVCRMPDLYPP
jgi:hypothetical protein